MMWRGTTYKTNRRFPVLRQEMLLSVDVQMDRRLHNLCDVGLAVADVAARLAEAHWDTRVQDDLGELLAKCIEVGAGVLGALGAEAASERGC